MQMLQIHEKQNQFLQSYRILHQLLELSSLYLSETTMLEFLLFFLVLGLYFVNNFHFDDFWMIS